MIRLLIVDDISSTRDNLQKLLGFEDDIEVVGTAGDGKQAIEEARRLQPDIVLMDVNMPVMDGIQATEALAQEMPTSPVIIMSVQGERDYLRRAMQAGAREFLNKPFSHDELVAAIRRVHQLEQKKSSFLTRQAASVAPTAAEPTRTGPAEVIMVFSGKGGVGKTMVASNLAVAIAQETSAKVALVDLDLQFGDVGIMFNLDHPRSITDVVDAGDGLDSETLDTILAEGPGGIRVLLAPLSPELADLVSSEHVRLVVSELRRQFDYVVVDTSAHLAESALEVIDMATRVIVVTALTIPAIKDAKLMLKVLESLNVDAEAIKLVVNRVDGYSDFNRESIESNLRTPVVAQIPHDPRVVGDAITRGTPFVITQPESDISRAVRELVSQIVPQSAAVGAGAGGGGDKRRRKGLFGR